ncbi:MAG: hypothetical protein DPW09_20940 [Anaerolineae bacterium]|nr:hypothetical protein [Anaerolineae bacterium]
MVISDEKFKELIKEILIEMIKEKRDLFYELILEAMEEAGLAKAISEGRKDSFVSEDQILAILQA